MEKVIFDTNSVRNTEHNKFLNKNMGSCLSASRSVIIIAG